MIKKETVDKHYNISKEVLEKLQDKSKGKFPTEVKALEYYLGKGFDYEEIKINLDKLLYNINRCASEIGFVKVLLIQLFTNKRFAQNYDSADDKAYKEFIMSLTKDKFNN